MFQSLKYSFSGPRTSEMFIYCEDILSQWYQNTETIITTFICIYPSCIPFEWSNLCDSRSWGQLLPQIVEVAEDSTTSLQVQSATYCPKMVFACLRSQLKNMIQNANYVSVFLLNETANLDFFNSQSNDLPPAF